MEGGREERRKKKNGERKWKKKKKENEKEKGEEREERFTPALIAATTAVPVGHAQRSRARADEATGKWVGGGGVGNRAFGIEKDSGN